MSDTEVVDRPAGSARAGAAGEVAARVRGLAVAEPKRWAVQDLDLELRPGALHMVLGERDTGKTALLETLAGFRREARGSIALPGMDASGPRSGASARPGATALVEAGAKERRRLVRLIPQETSSIQLLVVERLLLHRPPRRFGIAIHRTAARDHARSLAARVGLETLLDVPVESLRPLERRLLELAAALDQEPSLLLLDEPTSELGPHEAREFLSVLRAAASERGLPVLYSSARPRDAYPEAEAVTLLWRGRPSATVRTDEVTESALLERWTGGAGYRLAPTGHHTAGDTLLKVEALVLEGRGRESSLAGVSFDVKAGEVLAIVGAPADGMSLLHDVLLGHRPPERGSIQFLGKEMAAAARRLRVESGMGFVNPPLARDQSLRDFTVEENLILGQTRHSPFARRGWLKFDSIRGNAVRLLTDFEVPDASPRDRFRSLSLGARQRIVVAREVLRNPVLLIVRSPAQGLSLEAQEYVRKALILQCERGSGLLWLTEEPEEALRVADRLGVLAAGRMTWLPVTETLTRQAIADEMSGAAA